MRASDREPDTEEAGSSRKIQPSFTLPRVLYCVGAMARIQNALQNFYLNPFLLDTVGLSAALTGNVLLIKQIWDAFTDPLVGYASDNLDSKYGRRKPFVYASSPFLWAAWILLWLQIDTIEESQISMFFYYLCVLLLLSLMNTCQAVPYRALIQDIAPTYGIRTRIVALQEVISTFSFMVAIYIQGIVSKKFSYPESGEPNYKVGFIVCALIFAPIVGFTRVFTCAFVKEKPVGNNESSREEDGILSKTDPFDEEFDADEFEEVDEVEEKLTGWAAFVQFLHIWKKALSFKDFALLVFSWLMANVLLTLISSNLLLYVKYYLGNDDFGTYFIVGMQFGSAVSLPFWTLVIRRIGKKMALFVGCFCLACFLGGCFFLKEGQGIVCLVLLPFCGMCSGSLSLCLTAMQPDCVEAYYLKHRQRHEGVLYSLFLLAGKIGRAITLALSSYVLALTGYVSAAEGGDGVVQNEATQQALRIMVFGAPVGVMVCICIAVLFMKDYRKEFGTVRSAADATARASVTGEIYSERVTKRVFSYRRTPRNED